MYSTASIGLPHIHMESSMGFSQAPPPPFFIPPPRWNTPSKVHAVSTNPDVLPSPSFNGIKGLTEF